jgi:hypothetical protein
MSRTMTTNRTAFVVSFNKELCRDDRFFSRETTFWIICGKKPSEHTDE